jgi:ATP-dependent protease ClpP protease subunit
MASAEPVHLRFLGEVDADSVAALLQAVEEEYAQGARRFVLLMSTIGGSVWHGLSAYNYLTGLPIEVETHNFGTVDSVGVVLYCAGQRRFSTPDARFVLHAPFFEFDDEALGERQLAERLGKLRVDARNMAAVLGRAVGRSPEEVEHTLRSRHVLGVEEAIEYGLVHEARTTLLPPGGRLRPLRARGPDAMDVLRLMVQAARPEGAHPESLPPAEAPAAAALSVAEELASDRER